MFSEIPAELANFANSHNLPNVSINHKKHKKDKIGIRMKCIEAKPCVGTEAELLLKVPPLDCCIELL